jgi:hypothetical protein
MLLKLDPQVLHLMVTKIFSERAVLNLVIGK